MEVNILNVLNPYKWLIVAALVAGAFGYHFYAVHEARQEAITATEDRMNTEYEAKRNAAALEAANASLTLTNKNVEDLNAKDQRIKAITSQLSVALYSLWQRQERQPSTDYSAATNTASACTGAQLYRQDSEFLVREAARADGVVAQRDYYYNRYLDAQTTLKNLSNATPNP